MWLSTDMWILEDCTSQYTFKESIDHCKIRLVWPQCVVTSVCVFYSVLLSRALWILTWSTKFCDLVAITMVTSFSSDYFFEGVRT